MAEAKTKPKDLEQFEEYQKAKYTSWKSNTRQVTDPDTQQQVTPDTRTEEQKAFDTYLETQLPYDGVIMDNVKDDIGVNINNIHQEFYIGSDNGYTNIDKMYKLGDKIAVFRKINPSLGTNPNKYTAVIVDGKVSQVSNEYHWIKIKPESFVGLGGKSKLTDPAGGGSVNITAEATAQSVPSSAPATAEVNVQGENLSFHFQIPKGEKGEKGDKGDAGTGGGGGGSTPIKAPDNVQVGEDITGEFGLNLFDYNEMSRDNKFRVSGHTFITNDKQQITKDDLQIKKLRVYNRIKEVTTAKYAKKSVTIEARVLESSETNPSVNHKLKALLSFTGKDGNITKEELLIPLNKPLKKEWTNSGSYGYLQFQIGGEGEDIKGKINIDAYYGTINPNRQDQKFVFKNYNGIDLYANGKGTKNIYRHFRLWDAIEESLNVVNLKDCKLLKHSLTENEDKSIYWVEAPDDCLTYAGIVGQEQKVTEIKTMLKENLMSSNLCDITASDADGTIGHPDKPFFLIEPQTHDVYIHGKGLVEKLCFQIIIGKEYAYKWREHLTQTQIIYPTQHLYEVKDSPTDHTTKNFKQLPLGGMIYVLNNGYQIETNKYKEIIEAGSDALRFTGSPFGYPDVVIKYSNVASIVPNRFERHDHIEF